VEAEIRGIVAPHEVAFVSAVTGRGLDALSALIAQSEGVRCKIEATLPITNGAFSLISSLHDSVGVETHTSSDSTRLSIACSEGALERIQAEIRAAGGEITSVLRPAQCDPESD